MSRILVTGGTGTLGRHVVSQLSAAGHDVALLSRRAGPLPSAIPEQPAGPHQPPFAAQPAVAWHTGDLRTGAGLTLALDGVECVVHCATGRGDRTAATHLLDAARHAGAPHIIYISIVGVDRIPFGYYRAKHDVERAIEASGLPYTTLRSTQFHTLIEFGARALAVSPVVVMPRGLRFQPIAAEEVATRLVDLATSTPAGRVDDMGGPEIHTADNLVRAYLRASDRRRMIVALPVPGKVFAAFRAGRNLTPEHAVGQQTFAEYLAIRFGTRRGSPLP